MLQMSCRFLRSRVWFNEYRILAYPVLVHECIRELNGRTELGLIRVETFRRRRNFRLVGREEILRKLTYLPRWAWPSAAGPTTPGRCA